MFGFKKKFLFLFCFVLLIQSSAQWRKINFSNIKVENPSSIIKYKDKFYVSDLMKGILYSKDNCNNWLPLNAGIGLNNGSYTVYGFCSDSTGLFAINQDGLYKLEEGDNHWENIINLPIVSMAKNNQVFIGGVFGNGVYISTDNGVTWTRNYGTAGNIWNALSIVAFNNKFFVSGDNGIFCSGDNGLTWQNIFTKPAYRVLLKGNTLFATTDSGIVLSTNEGQTWENLGPANQYVRHFEISDGKYFAGGFFAIEYYSKELTDWIPACRKSPDGFFNQVNYLKIIDDTLYSCNFGGVFRRSLKDFNYAELSLPDFITDEYYNKNVGEKTYLTFVIGNNGFDTLRIYDIKSSNPDFIISRTNMYIPPEWGFGVNLEYIYKDPGKHQTEITVISSDTLAINKFLVEIEGLPIDFVLNQNYPNPFNPDTHIDYVLPSTQFVSLKVFNSLGELVRVLVNEIQSGGKYSVRFLSEGLPSGIYLYQIQTDLNVETKKMVLLK